MRNYFTFNNTDCRTYGVYISGHGTFSAPARAYDIQSIPGRNGDLIGNEKRLQNLELTYEAFVYTNFKTAIQNFRSFLLSQVGYKRLIDTYHPDEYRMACYAGPFTPEMEKDNKAGKFDIVFNCKPQRFLLSGDTGQEFTANGTITNPTLFDAQPLIRVYGNGTLEVGSTTFTITNNASNYIDIDCAMMDAYRGATNCNAYVSINSNDFPVLPPGSTGIEISGITKAIITPRWWQL